MKSPIKGIFIVAIVVFALVFFALVINFAIGFFTGRAPLDLSSNEESSFDYQTSSIQVCYSPGKDLSYFVVDDAVLDDTVSGKTWVTGSSRDGTIIFVIDSEHNGYLVTSKGVQKFARFVTQGILSSDGSKGVYVDGDEGAIYLFDTASPAPQKIDSGGGWNGWQFAFSPRGDTLVYTFVERIFGSSGSSSSSYGQEMRVYSNGSITTIGENLLPLSVSSGGAYIYCYHRDNGSLYCANAKTGDLEKLSSDYVGYGALVNADRSEIIFVSDSGLYYVEKNGERVMLCDDVNYCSQVTPTNAGLPHSLKKHVYLADSMLFYLDENLEVNRIASDVSYAKISDDLKTLYYARDTDNSLYRTEVGSDQEPQRLGGNVAPNGFQVSGDQKHIYFIDTDDNLRYLVSDTEAKRIASDVSSLIFSDNGRLYYLYGPGHDYKLLGSSQNGSNGKKLETGIYSIFSTVDNIFIMKGNWEDYALCVLKDGKIEKLLDGLEVISGMGGGPITAYY